MDSNEYKVTEEQMLNALKIGIKETLKIPKGQKGEADNLVSTLRDYKALNPEAVIFLQTKYGTMSQQLAKCDIYSPNGENITFIFK